MLGFEQTGEHKALDAITVHDLSKLSESEMVALPFFSISGIPAFRRVVWSAIVRLYQAALFADDCESPRGEFSIQCQDLLSMGLRAEELLWLVKKNVVKQSQQPKGVPEHPSPEAIKGSVKFSPTDTFVLGDDGIELFEQSRESVEQISFSTANAMDLSEAGASGQPLTPAWDIERHELRCAGKLVKKFKWRAANQEAILAAFEEDGWPAHIDDPLPQQPEIDPKRRLADAIKSLNRHQQFPLIRFCGDGTGEGVLWEFKR